MRRKCGRPKSFMIQHIILRLASSTLFLAACLHRSLLPFIHCYLVEKVTLLSFLFCSWLSATATCNLKVFLPQVPGNMVITGCMMTFYKVIHASQCVRGSERSRIASVRTRCDWCIWRMHLDCIVRVSLGCVVSSAFVCMLVYTSACNDTCSICAYALSVWKSCPSSSSYHFMYCRGLWRASSCLVVG